MNNLQSLSYYLPELILITVIISGIIYDLFIAKEESYKVGFVLLVGLLVVAIAIFFQNNEVTSLFTSSVVHDPFSRFFKLIIILTTIFVSVVSLKSGELKSYRKGEYFTLLGIIVFGLF